LEPMNISSFRLTGVLRATATENFYGGAVAGLRCETIKGAETGPF
jgi:hypothetical protein